MLKKVLCSEIASIRKISDRLYSLRMRLENENRDTALSFGNGSVSVQLGCAEAALECILQELEF